LVPSISDTSSLLPVIVQHIPPETGDTEAPGRAIHLTLISISLKDSS
jgi:hypothetical protein